MTPSMSPYLAAAKERKLQEIPYYVDPDPEGICDHCFPPRESSFHKAVTRPTEWTNVVAEFMRRSNIAHAIKLDFAVRSVAKSYEQHGVGALSIFVDKKFGGEYEDLMKARNISELPILCMDFIVDRRQLLFARSAGADAVLLIAQMLDPAELKDLCCEARVLKMEPVVEISSVHELKAALSTGTRIIGINNRSFDTFGEVNFSKTPQLAREIPPEIAIISESGFESRDHIQYILDSTEGRVRAILVGAALSRQRSLAALKAKISELTKNP